MDPKSQRLRDLRSVEQRACLARLNVPLLRTLIDDMQTYFWL
jgi:hypothetical protein